MQVYGFFFGNYLADLVLGLILPLLKQLLKHLHRHPQLFKPALPTPPLLLPQPLLRIDLPVPDAADVLLGPLEVVVHLVSGAVADDGGEEAEHAGLA